MSSTSIQFHFNQSSVNDTILLAEIIKQHRSILKTSVGPFLGKSKLLYNSNNPGARSVLTNSSKHLLEFFCDLKHLNESNSNDLLKWKLSLIASVMAKSHIEHYYDAGLFLFYMINEQLAVDAACIGDELNVSRCLLDYLLTSLCIHLKEETTGNGRIERSNIALKLDLSNTRYLSCLLETCLSSKNVLDEQDKSMFIKLCLKAFINSFQIDSSTFAGILYIFESNAQQNFSNSKLFDGVLFKQNQAELINDITRWSNLNSSKSIFKCVIFDASFSGDFQQLDEAQTKLKFEIDSNEANKCRISLSIVKKSIEMCDHLIEKFKIDVFLCQKVKKF
jgi:hypothetical protein